MASQAVAPTTVHGTLIDAAARLDGLLRSVHSPQATAIGHWTAVQTAAHLAVLSTFDALTCRADVGIPSGLETILDRVKAARIADIEDINAVTLDLFDERDLGRLADHIAMHVGILALATAAEPDREVRWLGDLPLPVSAVAAHYVGEIAIHGRDIARSQDLPWEITGAEARIAFEECYIPILQVGGPTMFQTDNAPVSVEFRVPGQTSYTVDMGPGRFSAGPTASGRADVVLTSDPVTAGLMMFERINPFVAVATGRVKVGGRRPWRILRFRRQLRMP